MEDVDRIFGFIGRVASAFGSLEIALEEHIWNLVNREDKKIGQIVLMRMNSFPAKVEIFRRLVLHSLGLPETPEEVKALVSGLEVCCKRRDDIVHSTYLGIAGEAHKLHQRWPEGRKRDKIVAGEKKAVDYGASSISEDELKASLDAIEETEFDLLTFMTTRIYGRTEPGG